MELLNENKSLRDSQLCLSYLGAFDDEITDKLIGISEYYLKSGSELSKLSNKVSFLIAECFQNIVRHAETKENIVAAGESTSDFFQINVFDNKTVLTSSNLVDNTLVADLERKIIQVNSLDADGLKKLHNNILNSTGFSNKGGAGLGLIEMARKSGLPLKYSFKKTGGNFSRFFLLLEISVNKNLSNGNACINEIEDFYNTLYKDGVIMLFKGDLSKDTIIPLMEMVQNNFSDSKEVFNKKNRSIITLIEALQNVSRHGKAINGAKEGIFILSKSEDSYMISVGNPIEKENRLALEDNLSEIKSMGTERLKEYSKQKLIESQVSTAECGMGLLKIARNSSGNFQYSFTELPNDSLFFTLKVNV